ncbi:hypothetical protein C5167_042637 [Papaver somniferum]|uniref:Uncharacterized protein n=1 Tax=Papaver somniferum TaxID=3469 RepID=A0A4Y7L538_PAPSO|nr:hypothetical protein C5167_042637 [Papaver somniferum]
MVQLLNIGLGLMGGDVSIDQQTAIFIQKSLSTSQTQSLSVKTSITKSLKRVENNFYILHSLPSFTAPPHHHPPPRALPLPPPPSTENSRNLKKSNLGGFMNDNHHQSISLLVISIFF